MSTTDSSPVTRFERRLGDAEASYFLPSRQNGVNDMYLLVGFDGPPFLVHHARVRVIWAILRLRHPLLASRVAMHDYDDIRFVYTPPQTVEDALAEADKTFLLCTQTKQELLESYLNGPRTLSDDRLAYLIISEPSMPSVSTPPPTPNLTTEFPRTPSPSQYELMICATHFLGDGMAGHQCAHDILAFLGGGKSQSELEQLLAEEHRKYKARYVDAETALPSALEDNFAPLPGRLRSAVSRVHFKRYLEKQIGGHVFPRRSDPVRHTVVPTVPFDPEHTKKMLKACKAHGVSISAAMFAICNAAWARTCKEKRDLPILMYSPINVRPYVTRPPKNDSYWYLAISYFNIILPSFFPTDQDVTDIFWHRARMVKQQSLKVAKSRMIVTRILEMARERARIARTWARVDDEQAREGSEKPSVAAPTVNVSTPAAARAPTSALLGTSMLGNLDAIYKHTEYPSLRLRTLTTGSRQRNGGMLLFGYTFAGQMWLSFGYDENAFDRVVLETFWKNVLAAMQEFLV